MFPGATLEDPPEFKVKDDPSTLTVGRVLQITEKRVSVVRDDAGFYAVYLICTHLGCTPNYVTDVVSGSGVSPDVAQARGERKQGAIPDGWACPCHGSRYFIDSTNFYGPAPRPMDWVDVKFGKDGKLLVDRGQLVVQRQAGDQTPPKWRLDPETKKDNGKTYGV
jgi:cytochrome b6-f complex iron-sulfur subunit